MSSLKRPESVLVVVYTSAGEILLMERVHPQAFWQSVTGSMEWHEDDPLVTAKRELQEETGIDAQNLEIIDCHSSRQFPIKPAWQHRFAPGTQHNTEHVFRVRLPVKQAITLNPAEHTTYLWLPRAEALQKVSSYTNHDAILTFVPE